VIDRETLTLMHQVAQKLTGQPVTIRFQEPKADLIARGACYKGLDGRAVIDIDPYFAHPCYELFELFTHELAHAKLHLPVLAPVNAGQPGAVFHVVSKHASATAMSREEEAEAQANQWRRFAALNCELCYAVYKTRFYSMLETLLKHYPTNP
jgi:hypothetical protein